MLIIWSMLLQIYKQQSNQKLQQLLGSLTEKMCVKTVMFKIEVSAKVKKNNLGLSWSISARLNKGLL